MRYYCALICIILALFFGACSNTDSPFLGAPEAVATPASGDVAGPRFSQGEGGELVLSWMEIGASGTTLNYATLIAGEFSAVRPVVTEPRMFVNWADLPSVLPLGENRLIAHWLRYSADKTYSYDVVVSQSFDGGTTWDDAITAHTDGTPTEHGFVSMVPAPDGVSLLWLDGRNTPDGSMTLRSAVITPDGQLTKEQEVDESVCDCCQTDMAITARGAVAVYRDRTAAEIRDISISRVENERWLPGRRVHADNWTIPGCPVNGPSIVARGEQVAVAWFTAASDLPVVKVVRSADSGVSFTDPLEIASGAINGYVGLAALEQGSLAVSWVAKNEAGDNVLRVRAVSGSGEPGPVQDVATIHQLRVFPQLAFVDDHLWFAWTDDDTDQRYLAAARIPVTLP
ncbi:MAG: hypothetical protein KC572_13875 [Gammaproteobacteria bacterium]|nr:hypothetical protein [Gammaproteobacteria bacterium]